MPSVLSPLLENGTASSSFKFQKDLRHFMRGKWLLLVGDSAVRYLYHHILNTVLYDSWDIWPPGFDDRKTMDDFSCALFDPNMSFAAQPCVEDAFVGRGVGLRITMASSRYGVPPDLKPIEALLNATLGAPDLVLVGIGAWFALSDHYLDLKREFSQQYIGSRWNRETMYIHAVDTLSKTLAELCAYRRTKSVKQGGADGRAEQNASEYFRAAWQAPLHVWLGIPFCPYSPGNTHNPLVRTQAMNNHARRTILQLPPRHGDWIFLDRQAFGPPCSQRECQGWPHPVGHTLNLHLHAVMHAAASARPQT